MKSETKLNSEHLFEPAAPVTIILKNNFFEIGEEIYHQLLGTTTGTKVPLTYANLFMVGLEKKIFANTNFKPFYGVDI